MSLTTLSATTCPRPLDLVGCISSREQRSPIVQACRARGLPTIDDELYSTAVALVIRGWHVQGEVFTGSRVTWYVFPAWSATDSQRSAWTDELYALGERSPFPAVTCNGYRIDISLAGDQ